MKTKPLEPRKAAHNVDPLRRQKETHQKYDENGGEIMDPTPIAPPIGYKKSLSIAEQIRQMIKSEKLRQEAEEAGYETFEEADDFDVDDDFDPRSPFEEIFEPIPQPSDEDHLKQLGTIIGSTIMTQLGGSPEPAAASDPEGPKHQAPAAPESHPTPEGRREPPTTTSTARGFLKPRAT